MVLTLDWLKPEVTPPRDGWTRSGVEFVKPDSEDGRAIARVLIKDVDKKRYTATEVVAAMRTQGYRRFGMGAHTELWQSLDAKVAVKGFGGPGLYKGQWGWFDSWIARVRAHCEENAGRYR